MELQMLSEQKRLNMLPSHPVITKDYLLITPVIRAVYGLIRERIYMRYTGTFMYATPRMGKTSCSRAVKLLLEGEFPDIFVISFIAESRGKQASTAGLLMDILHADRLVIPRSARYKDLQRMLLTHIQSNLVMRKGRQFVLMIDEMQNLTPDELIQLATIHNRLEPLDIRMTTLGFAQPEILHIRTALMETSQHFLIARFLSEPIPFNGCASEQDLEQILSAYDEEQYYPEDSDYTFTRFFLPQAYDSGFRLRHYTQPLWKALRSASKQMDVDSIPMEHLSRSIEFILVLAQQSDANSFKLTRELIDIAVQASGLKAFSGVMGLPISE